MKYLFPLFLFWFAGTNLQAQVRLKDIASIEGVRSNHLSGFGLVVGLNGTGDKDQTRFTVQAVVNALAKSGLALDPTTVKVKNVAFVMVQSELPAFTRSGSRIDVIVSSYGDATSLQGGTLLWTELKGADGFTYAIAQGPLSIGGFSAGNGGSSVTQNHPTVGRVPEGAIVEREVFVDFANRTLVRFVLRQADFTTMSRVVEAVNQWLGSPYAKSINSRTLEITLPVASRVDPVGFVASAENISVLPDMVARVVINEKTGTIIIGKDVRIDKVAISHGNLTILVESDNLVSQPNPLSQGATTIQANQTTTVDNPQAHVMVAKPGVSLGIIADTLNALKVTPRDVIAILQGLKESGALHAELKLI